MFAVLGNHDLAIARDPQTRRSDLRELRPARLLRDEGALVELRGRSIWIAGTYPQLIVRGAVKVDPNALSRDADFRILLSHFPRVLDRLEPDRFELVLAGHMHDGQITIPYPGGKLRLAHPTARYANGIYQTDAAAEPAVLRLTHVALQQMAYHSRGRAAQACQPAQRCQFRDGCEGAVAAKELIAA